MAKLEILTIPDPRLREVAQPVEKIDDRVRSILSDMAETMYDAPGVGLAAPQVGILERLIVVDIGDRDKGIPGKLYKLINPEISASSGKMEFEEGCLSIPGIREKVSRPEFIKVKALDENGQSIQIEAEGLLSICIQHEIDHLNGVLFIDRLSRVRKELIRSKLNRLMRKESRSK
jgi:peptide deformylase